MIRYCKKHETPMPFETCVKVMHVDENRNPKPKNSESNGKFTIRDCGIAKAHPKHLHCSDSMCLEVSNLKHPAYNSEWVKKQ